MTDPQAAVVWLGATAALASAAWRAGRAAFPADSVFEAVLHAVVIGCAVIVGVGTAAGLAGELRAGPLIGGVTACSLALYLWAARRPVPDAPPAAGWAAALWCVVGAAWAGHVLSDGLFKLPSDFDTINYHLPMIDSWLQARSLLAPACDHWSTPGNHALVGVWCVAPFTGDFLSALNNLPACACLAAATFSLVRALGAGAGLAHLTALGAVTNAVVWTQLTDSENDVAAAGYFVAGVAYAHRYAARFRPPDLGLAAVCVGLLAGVKFYALGYAALAALTLVALVAVTGGVRRAAAAAGAAAAGGLALGGSWYIRNWVVTGSPLYPRDFARPRDTLSHLYPDVPTTSFVGNGDPDLVRLGLEAVGQVAGPNAFVAVVLLPIVLAGLVWSGARSASRAVLAAQLAGAAGLLLVTPFAVEDAPGTLNQIRWQYCPVRYGLCALTLAQVGLAVVAYDVLGRPGAGRGGRAARYAPLALLAAGAAAFAAAHADMRASATTGLTIGLMTAGLNAWGLARVAPTAFRWGARAALVAALGLAPAGAEHLSEKWHAEFASHFNRVLAVEFLNRYSELPPDSTRVCVLDYRCYPYYGSARQFYVCRPVYIASPDGLHQYLTAHGVTLVATTAGPNGRLGWHSFLDFNVFRDRYPASAHRISPMAPVILYQVIGSRVTAPLPPRAAVRAADDTLRDR